MKRILLASITVVALIVISAVVYLARQRVDETGNAPINNGRTPERPAVSPSSVSPALATCVGPMDPQISKANLVARHQWAESLLLKNHVDAAVTELRNIATLDPGYPAINYQISDALLKSKHANDAKESIKLQVEISECLSKLPPPDIQAYCKSEWVTASPTGCVQELAKIDYEAHYKAGQIDAGLNHATNSTPPPDKVSSPAIQPPQLPPDKVAPATTAPVTTATVAAVQPIAPASSPQETVAPKLPPPPKITSVEASEHVGQQAIVCGAIVSKHTATESNGKPTFVNLDHAFPDQTFTVVIWDKDSPAVGDFPSTGDVCVTGTIAAYRGTPEIVVHDAQSWYKAGQP